MSRLDAKCVLVTGAAQGVGAAIARRCVNEGAHVVLADVLDDAGLALAREIGAHYQHLDITDGAQWRSAIAFVTTSLGGLDGLVNNAAILHMGPIETT